MSLIIQKDHVKNVCGNTLGEKCCSYLGVGGGGWECFKESNLKRQIDYKREKGLMNVKGDNCSGYENEIKNNPLKKLEK